MKDLSPLTPEELAQVTTWAFFNRSEPIPGLVLRYLNQHGDGRRQGYVAEYRAIHQVVQICAECLGVPTVDLLGKGKASQYVLARHICWFLCREVTTAKFTEIADAFQCDYSTIVHAMEKVKRLVREDLKIAASVETIRDRIRAL